jgi:hypothetical protein
MLEGMIFLVNGGISSFGDLFAQLEQAGAFRYIIPFLFIFSLVFGILSKTKIFDNNKGINVIIALAVGLMALQTNFVSNFLTIVSPLLGVGLVILLVSMIFLGLVAPKESWLVYTLFGIGALVLINILLDVAQSTGSPWWDWWLEWKVLIITFVVLGILFLSINAKKENNFGDIVGDTLKKITG